MILAARCHHDGTPLQGPLRGPGGGFATNQPPAASPRTLAALERDGLIVKLGKRELGRDRFGPIAVPVYEVPLVLHMQWCAWAAEQPDSPAGRET